MVAPRYLRPSTVAKRLDVSVYTVRRWIAEGELESQPVGRQHRISEEQLADFLRRSKQQHLDRHADK